MRRPFVLAGLILEVECVPLMCNENGHVINGEAEDKPIWELRCACGQFSWWELSRQLKPTSADMKWANEVLAEI